MCLKRIILTLFGFICIITSVIGDGISFEAEVPVLSKYVWRGTVITDGPVCQPSVTAGMKGLSVNVWGNIDLDNTNELQMNFTEFDYTLDYSKEFTIINVSAGVIHYRFLHAGGAKTTELYGEVSLSVPGNPALTIYHDIDEVKGTYGALSGNTSLPLGLTQLELSASLGFGSEDYNIGCYGYRDLTGNVFGPDSASLTDILFSVGFPFGLGKLLSVAPSVTVTSLLNDDAKEACKKQDVDTTNVIFGITASAGF